jgi:diacylglycerol kinase family enzyme
MKVQLIFNPVAGQLDVAQALQKVTAYLEAQGWQVTLRQTRGSGDATAFAREAAASGYDMVVAVGGDGTLGEVANGLAGSDCTMGVLPVGTGNIWARMMRLPLPSLGHQDALMAAAQVLVEGTPHRIDLGRAGDRYFVMWTGIGLDAQVARDVEPTARFAAAWATSPTWWRPWCRPRVCAAPAPPWWWTAAPCGNAPAWW